MRASRLMALLMLCRTRDRWTASELAAQLGVSVRTIYRDVSALQASGVPLWTETGPGGGIHLLRGWRNELDALSGDEAAALFLSGVPSAVSDLGLGAVTLSAQLKVRSALPPELQRRSGRIQERFHLDAPGWFHRPDPLEQLPTIADAVWSARRLDLTYTRAARAQGERTDGAAVRRRVDPLGLVLKAGTWYLVARHRGRVTTYRVGRVDRAVLREEPFARPEEFDLATWWAQSSAEFDRSLLRFRCQLRLSPAAQRQLPRVTDLAAARRALDDAKPVPGDTAGDTAGEWVELWLECESEEVAAQQLLSLGGGVEVRRPAGLRERMRVVGATLVAHHGPDHRPRPRRARD